jgi:hypothetical protein
MATRKSSKNCLGVKVHNEKDISPNKNKKSPVSVRTRLVRLVSEKCTYVNGLESTYTSYQKVGKNFTYGAFDCLSPDADALLSLLNMHRSDFDGYYTDEQQSEDDIRRESVLFLEVLPHWLKNYGPAGTSLENLPLNKELFHTDVHFSDINISTWRHMLAHVKLDQIRKVATYDQMLAGLFPPVAMGEGFEKLVYSGLACRRLLNAMDKEFPFYHQVFKNCPQVSDTIKAYVEFYTSLKKCAFSERDDVMLIIETLY